MVKATAANNGIAAEYCKCPECSYEKCEITRDYDTVYFYCHHCGYDAWKR